MDSYFLVRVTEDGDTFISQHTKLELLTVLESRRLGPVPKFEYSLSGVGKDGVANGRDLLFVIKGVLITPSSSIVWTIPE